MGDETLTWDPLTGLLTDVALGDVTTSLGRNGLGDLTQAVTSYAGAEVLRVGYARGAMGRVATRSEGPAGQQPQRCGYEYDAPGNLVAVGLPDGRAVEYVLDARSRRLGKKVDGTLVQGFVYGRGPGPVAELDGAGAVVSRFVYGTRGHVPDYMVREGQIYRLITDHLGSVLAAQGSISEREVKTQVS